MIEKTTIYGVFYRAKEDESLFKMTGLESHHKGIPALSSLLVIEGHRMIRQSVEQLSKNVPALLKSLKSSLLALGDPVESVLEKKGYFDELSHELGPRIRELLDGFKRPGDSDEILMNLHIQSFLEKYGKKFTNAKSAIFQKHSREKIETCLS